MRAGSFASRFVALALLAFVILAALLLIVAPILTARSEMASTIEVSRDLLYRYRALSARHAQLAARLEAVQRTATDVGAYITGSSDTLAGAELQTHVQSIIERSGGELHSIQILPVEPAIEDRVKLEAAASRVALKLKLAVEMGRLQDLLYDLETAQPFVFIRELIILGAGHSGDAGAKPMLDVTLQVYGFTRATSVKAVENAQAAINGMGQPSGPRSAASSPPARPPNGPTIATTALMVPPK